MADGHVRIERGGQIWLGEHIDYNFKTRQMRSEQFRTGKPPVFAAGKNLQGNTSNQVYTAQHACVTTDDVSDPAVAHPGEPHPDGSRPIHRGMERGVVRGRRAGVLLSVLPANLGAHANNWNFTPGYRSAYGPFLLTTYTWWLNDPVDGALHLDYREKRGLGVGPDLNLHLGRWGDAEFKYYYLHDLDSGVELEHEQLPESVRPDSRKPPARLFRLAGDAVHEPEPQGAGELPDRPADAARFF